MKTRTKPALKIDTRYALPKLSEEACAARAPRAPEELVGALQNRVHPTSGRLLSAKPIATTQRKYMKESVMPVRVSMTVDRDNLLGFDCLPSEDELTAGLFPGMDPDATPLASMPGGVEATRVRSDLPLPADDSHSSDDLGVVLVDIGNSVSDLGCMTSPETQFHLDDVDAKSIFALVTEARNLLKVAATTSLKKRVVK